ncbi:MAG: hypothetical protein FWD08_04350, partial [Alphaproteobacteria bacterium]|nr:hypothetical protein [Alphaproteobacteria bacterium]
AHVDLVLADVYNKSCDIVEFLAKLRFTHPDLVRLLIVGDDGDSKLGDPKLRENSIQTFNPSVCL